MTLKEFTRKLNYGVLGEHLISIRAGGVIGLSNKMVKKYGINKYKFVKLFYDDETDEIAIKFTMKRTYGSAKIFENKQKGRFIPCVSFLKFCGLDTRKDSDRFEYRYDKEREYFIFGPIKKAKIK